jgi:hypothetical protein
MPRAPRRCAGSFAELMARNVDNRKAPPFFWKRFKIRLDEDLNGITAGVNFDANGRIAKFNFVRSSVLSSNDRMGQSFRHIFVGRTAEPAVLLKLSISNNGEPA